MTHRIFDEYARRVELEMSPAVRADNPTPTIKVCPVCDAECAKDAEECHECGHQFSPRKVKFKTCGECESLNPITAKECQVCGHSFRHEFEISLNEALRMGAIVRGMDLNEDEVRQGEEHGSEILKDILSSGDDVLINIAKKLPEESFGRLKNILNRGA